MTVVNILTLEVETCINKEGHVSIPTISSGIKKNVWCTVYTSENIWIVKSPFFLFPPYRVIVQSWKESNTKNDFYTKIAVICAHLICLTQRAGASYYLHWHFRQHFSQNQDCGYCPPSLKVVWEKDPFTTRMDRKNNCCNHQLLMCTMMMIIKAWTVCMRSL